jgi:hypothetical protein
MISAFFIRQWGIPSRKRDNEGLSPSPAVDDTFAHNHVQDEGPPLDETRHRLHAPGGPPA